MVHKSTMPKANAQWWHEFCLEMKLKSTIKSVPFYDLILSVTVLGTESDIDAAWALWHEEFVRICH